MAGQGTARFDIDHTVSDLAPLFPITSQTSPEDKLCLLGAMRLVRRSGSYAYLEIGSFRGGSLTPCLMDDSCKTILSIDDRGRMQPDERGVNYDYTGITTQTMLDELRGSGVSTDKLKTFDGSIPALERGYAGSFDLAFIDGEHTDEACFRDFLWTRPLMKPDGIILFHDSTLVYKALKLILLVLDQAAVPYAFFKRADSEMSGVLLGSYRDADRTRYVGAEEDHEAFFARAEASRIKAQFKNRARFRFVPQRLLKGRMPITVDIERPKNRRAF